MSSLYQRLGGPVAVEELVDRLDERIVLDPELAGYFAGASLGRLAAHQRELMAVLFGGAGHYTGRRLSDAHHGLGLTDRHFDRFLAHLSAALEGMGAGADLQTEAQAVFEALRAEIVQR